MPIYNINNGTNEHKLLDSINYTNEPDKVNPETILEPLMMDYDLLVKALEINDYETIQCIGHSLAQRGIACNFKALTTLGTLLELEAKSMHNNELDFLIKGFSGFIRKLLLKEIGY